jgi:hypothetical protein
MKNIFFLFILIINCKNDSTNTDDDFKARILGETQKMKTYLKANPKFNQELVFLADMKMPSNKYRFFVYSFKTNKIIDKGLVAHGSGSETENNSELKFSNVINSNATSLGKYQIGDSYKGKFGKSYRLHGLDTTNSNAYVRNVVLHSFADMPTEEDPLVSCTSLGCPMVSVLFFERLEKIIDLSEKPLLMHIYY